MADEIPVDLGQFVAQNVDSLAQLESLLLLRRHASRPITVMAAAKALYISVEMCAVQLAELEKRGLIVAVPTEHGAQGYQYRPSHDDVDRLIKSLDALYRERRVAIVTLIYSKPVNKVQTFADAFRLRKEE